MQRQRGWKISAVLTGVVVIAIGACDAGEIVADAMVDAAEVLRDGANDDARAQPPALEVITAELACDIATEEILSDGGGSVEFRTRHWYAELRDARIDPMALRQAEAVGCSERPLVQHAPCAAQPPVTSCSGTPPLPPLPCRTYPVEIDSGVLRVHCLELRDERNVPAGGPDPWPADAALPPTLHVTLALE